jgi:hypothetical protein
MPPRRQALRDAFASELAEARSAEAARDLRRAWRHLERAHILSQPFAWLHLRIHGSMFGFAWRQRDVRELLGQLPRLALAAPGSWTGRAPRGNTGGADVGIFTPMPIPADLEDLLRAAAAWSTPRTSSGRQSD